MTGLETVAAQFHSDATIIGANGANNAKPGLIADIHSRRVLDKADADSQHKLRAAQIDVDRFDAMNDAATLSAVMMTSLTAAYDADLLSENQPHFAPQGEAPEAID